MFTEGKVSKGYLRQLSGNVEEKTSVITDAFRNGGLPKNSDGKVVIVELGIGGGDSAKRMQEFIGRTDTEVIGVDILPEIAHLAREGSGISSLVADAAHLPMRDNSVSAINASAIFHEVSSYGTKEQEETFFGTSAVELAMSEAKRVLLTGGILAYRDIAGPTQDLQHKKNVLYTKRSWKRFVEWFVPDFLSSGPRFYNEESFVKFPEGEGLRISAPVGLHREIQRHYLTLRDYINLQMKEGVFSIERAGSSDIVDTAIEKALEDDDSKIKALCEAWKIREGSEWYIYTTPTDFLSFACTHEKSDQVLFPSSPLHIKKVSRHESNRYLKQVIDDPEFEGKIIMELKKMSLDESRLLLRDSFISDKQMGDILDLPKLQSFLDA